MQSINSIVQFLGILDQIQQAGARGQAVWGQIKGVLSNLSKATVIVTHDQLEALTMADRIAIMRDGLIEQVGSPHDVFAKPANVFVASFIGTPQMNLIEAEFKSYSDGKATVTFDRQDVDLPADPAAAALALAQRPRHPVHEAHS